jgi:SAM-dependent methyltransferase
MPESANQVSFRDPGGRVFRLHGRVFRAVSEAGYECLQAALHSSAVQDFIERRRFVQTKVLAAGESGFLDDPSIAALLQGLRTQTLAEHEAIPFPNFPYEWAPEMLWAAGVLTLDLADALLREDLGLKDATPYNVMFRGPEPVFIDVLSVERRDPHNAIWLPKAEFVRTFLLPLLAFKRAATPLEHTLSTRQGLEPEMFYRWLTPLERLFPRYLNLISIPVWLAAWQDGGNGSIYKPKLVSDVEQSRYILGFALRGLRRQLKRLAPSEGHRSTWTDYMASSASYTREQFTEKEQFVTRALHERSPRMVLDAGCNTGHFSAIAASSGASVVAIDADPAVVGRTWRRARAEGLDILPLVVNLARPSPSIGWRNNEYPSFLARATGAFDCILMLAVIHHLLATERIPLQDILKLAAEITTDTALIEFVSPDDPMFRRLSRGRDELYRHLSIEFFEQTCKEHFEVIRSVRLKDSHRWLYFLKKRE